MIKEPTYYQAQCDICGAVDDGGEFSAWADPESARAAAVDGAGWTEIEVAVPSTCDGPHVYVRRREGEPLVHERSILVCENHGGSGLFWCSRCEDDLDGAGWAIWPSGNRLSQTCPNGHENRVDLLSVAGDDAN